MLGRENKKAGKTKKEEEKKGEKEKSEEAKQVAWVKKGKLKRGKKSMKFDHFFLKKTKNKKTLRLRVSQIMSSNNSNLEKIEDTKEIDLSAIETL